MRYFHYACGAVTVFMLCLYGDAAMAGAAKGAELFIYAVFPALFPFAVCIGCLKRLGCFSSSNASGADGFWGLVRFMLLGAIAGNPTGSMLLSDSERISMRDRSVYSALFNLASPIFIMGTLSARLLGLSGSAVWLIMASHYGSAALLFSLYRLYAIMKRRIRNLPCDDPRRAAPRSGESFSAAKYGRSFIEVFPDAVTEAALTMLKLLGTIVFFVAVSALLKEIFTLSSLHPAIRAASAGLIEMTNGLSLLASSDVAFKLKLELACFLMSFGGICIFMQANAVLRVDGIAYLCAKLLHAATAFMLCGALFPLFFTGSAQTFGNESLRLALERTVSAAQLALLSIIASVSASLAAVFIASRRRT